MNQNVHAFIVKVSKVGDRSWGQPESSLFNSYYTEVSSTIFKVFGMTQGLPDRWRTLYSLGQWASTKKLATIVEGDQKAPSSMATTPKYRGGRYSFPRIALLYSWYVPYIAEC